MAQMFVMCPECGLRAELTHGKQQIADPKGTCKHRQSPMSCPILAPSLNVLRQMLKPAEQPG
jgi:hypothetical protein